MERKYRSTLFALKGGHQLFSNKIPAIIGKHKSCRDLHTLDLHNLDSTKLGDPQSPFK